MNSPWSQNTEKHDASNQALVEQVGNVFKAEVVGARGAKLRPDDELFSGKAWLGDEAKSLGLLDSIGTFESPKSSRFKDLNVHTFRPRQTFQDRIGLQAMAREFGAGLAAGFTSQQFR